MHVPDGINCLTFSTCIIFGEKTPKRTIAKLEKLQKATTAFNIHRRQRTRKVKWNRVVATTTEKKKKTGTHEHQQQI